MSHTFRSYHEYEKFLVSWVKTLSPDLSISIPNRWSHLDFTPAIERSLWVLLTSAGQPTIQLLLNELRNPHTVLQYLARPRSFISKFLFFLSNLELLSLLFNFFYANFYLQRSHDNNRVLLYVHHRKFVTHLKSSNILDDIDYSWLVYSTAHALELGLEPSDPVIFIIKQNEVCANPILKPLLSLSKSLIHTFLAFKPKLIITFEGDAPYHSVLSALCNYLNIKTCCFQWGILDENKLSIAGSNMNFSVYFTWGDYFKYNYSPYNPNQFFESFGLVNEFDPPIANRGDGIIFYGQGVGNYIDIVDSNRFINLCKLVSDKFPGRVYFRPHPNSPLAADEIFSLEAHGVDIISGSELLAFHLHKFRLAVAIFSGALIDSIAQDIIPISFNTTSLPSYPIDLKSEGLGFEFNSEDSIFNFLSNIDNLSIYQFYLSQLIKNKNRFISPSSINFKKNLINNYAL